MLDLVRTKIQLSSEIDISSLSSNIEEGSVLEATSENGLTVAQLSSGSGVIFLGVSLSQFLLPTTYVAIETVTVPSSSPYTASLKNIPQDVNSLGIRQGTTAFTVGTGAPGASGAAQINTTNGAPNGTLTFNSADAGAILAVTYRYKLLADQAQLYVGAGQIGGSSASNVTGTIGVIQKGYVFTNSYDASVNWAEANIVNIRAGANGMFTRGASGAAVPGHVVAVPSGEQPFLGLYVDAQ